MSYLLVRRVGPDCLDFDEVRIGNQWIKVGMPRIRREMERTSFFLFGIDPITGKRDGPGGSGFFVSRQSKTLPGARHFYAVTCKHVIQNHSFIEYTDASGNKFKEDLEPDAWVSAVLDDISVADVTDTLEMPGDLEVFVIQEDLFLTAEFIERCNVGIGDETVMMGLFADHPGIPVGRFGAISAMASEAHPIRARIHEAPRPAFLVDKKSRGGFSGSFVVVYRTPSTNLANINGDGGFVMSAENNAFFRLLGVHRAQFQEAVKAEAVDEARAIMDGDTIRVPSSMTIVVPAWRISELLDDPRLAKRREERDSRPERIASHRAGASLEVSTG